MVRMQAKVRRYRGRNKQPGGKLITELHMAPTLQAAWQSITLTLHNPQLMDWKELNNVKM